MRKRIFSVLLTAALLLTMLPCGVFASEVQSADSYPGPEDIWYDENPVEVSVEDYLAMQTSGQSAAADTTASYSTDYPNTHVNTGNQAYDICCIALSQLGYTETPDNHTKYTAWLYGSDLSYAWCAIFISWCAGQADVSASTIARQGLASGYSTSNMSQNPYGCPAYAFGTTPKMGDIAFIGSGTSNHVGLVIGTSSSYIWCVEGNASDSVALRRYTISGGLQSYGGGSTGSTRILFYARPNYSGSSIWTSGITIDDNGNVTYAGSNSSGGVSVSPGGNAVTEPKAEVEPVYDFCKFTDVPGDVYFSQPVLWASNSGYASGVSDTQFGPYNNCTRAQVITFLWRMAGSPKPSYTEYYYYWAYSNFSDVVYGSYYYDAVVWAVENGIVSGTGDGYFGSDRYCTRAQAITFLYRLVNIKAGSVAYSVGASAIFEDVSYDAYYYNPVSWGYGQGIVSGTTATTFDPDLVCTRAQIVTFMYRVYQRYSANF